MKVSWPAPGANMKHDWHMITGEYPPRTGGVSDYAQLLAHGLAAEGEHVDVWAPSPAESAGGAGGLTIHPLPSGFGLRSLATLGSAIGRSGRPSRLLVQYVPQAFGYRGMNLPFCIWLSRRPAPVWTIFHEVLFPRRMRQSVRHRILATVTRQMARIAASASERVFVSTPAWADTLRSIAPQAPAAEWLPMPSTIPVAGDRSQARDVRSGYVKDAGALIGHFGSCGPLIAPHLEAVLPAVLDARPDASVVLIGSGGAAFRARLTNAFPHLSSRVWATGPLGASDISLHLLACDVMIQPFVDGVTSRRTSIMAALVHGVPAISTTGPLTEPVWAQTGAVALAPVSDYTALARLTVGLIDSPAHRQHLSAVARATYDEHFDIRHTMRALHHRRSGGAGLPAAPRTHQ